MKCYGGKEVEMTVGGEWRADSLKDAWSYLIAG